MRRPPFIDWIKVVVSATIRSRLFRKYGALFGYVVCLASLGGLVEIWFSYQDYKAALVRIQHEQADAAAEKIGGFVSEIEREIGWTVLLPWPVYTLQQRYLDAERLLHQVPAITELAEVDATGHEQLRVSQLTADVLGSGLDLSHEPKFVEAMAHKIYYGPVTFRRESEPYLTIALAGTREDAGVSIAEVNLKLILDVVSKIRVGERGHAYVVDAQGRLIAHPDISLVLRNTDMAHLAQVRSALGGSSASAEHVEEATDIEGQAVLAAWGRVPSLDWLVFVELPVEEVYAPLYTALWRAGSIFLGILALVLVAGTILVGRLVGPIRALGLGAARIGAGDLDYRISVNTRDELEALGRQFNSMAEQLQDSYANLERKVEERTRQLQLANTAKSRFIAAASHDLRQPLQALGLFIEQLRSQRDSPERDQLVERVSDSIVEMNELFNALLDISKLDAGVLVPDIGIFPIAHLLRRLEATFSQVAQSKGLRLLVTPSSAWVRSDPILLERILLNLISNAVRYTSRGGVIVACRRRGDYLRIEVWDSGAGIPEDQRRKIFDEFYQLDDPAREQQGGIGLGLAIVDRLRQLLGHPIELTSSLGKGSRFAITVPLAAARGEAVATPDALYRMTEIEKDKLVVVADNEILVMEGLEGLLRNWGCRVVTAASYAAAVSGLAGNIPDLIIADYHLSEGETGIDLLQRLRDAFETPIPGFLISADTSPERLQQVRASGYLLLHKPVGPMRLRAVLNEFLKRRPAVHGEQTNAASSMILPSASAWLPSCRS